MQTINLAATNTIMALHDAYVTGVVTELQSPVGLVTSLRQKGLGPQTHRGR